MKKRIREGLGKDIEDFLEGFLPDKEAIKSTAKNGCIEGEKLGNDVVVLKLKVKLGRG